jgi:hypothetical protein
MGTAKLKKELHACIENTQDIVLLQMVKEDIIYYSNNGTDVTDMLSAKQLKELQALAQEPDTDDSMTLTDYKKATGKWRTK